MEKYPHIFSPGRIGSLNTKNRIKYAATETNFPYGDGCVSDREVAYMEAQARGGPGIVTTQGAYPDKEGEGKGFKGMMAIYDDCFIPGLARIADVIRQNDALSCLQILHCGREGGVDLDYCLMSSVVPQKLSYFKPPREITTLEIKKTVKDHIMAARRAVKAGFDMIELSGIVGYLISTFISSYTNKRKDEYGGGIRERCRLMVEVIQGVKAEVGDKIPVGIRLCGLELLDDRGGNTIEESIESFRIAEEAGADYLSVTIGWHESSIPVITRDVPMGHWLYVSREIRKHVKVPVTMAFRQFLPSIPEKAIADGTIDFWEMCRPMIADPQMPVKIQEGREDEIIPCIACNLCFSRLYYHQPIMCSVRPTVGHEKDASWGYYGFSMVEKKKNVVIIGAGPAGLQCASVAAKRGHNVKLFEKDEVPGGSVLLASRVDDGSEELMRVINTLQVECKNAGVELNYGVECSPEMVNKMNADVLVIAAGASVAAPPIGFSGPIFTPKVCMQSPDALPSRLAIIGGGGIGLGIAVFLIRNGDYSITVIEGSSKLGRDVNPFYLWRYTKLLRDKKAIILTGATIKDIKDMVLFVATPKGERQIEIDGIITAEYEAPLNLKRLYERSAPDIHIIGDAKKPRRLNNAIHDGYRLGMVI